MVADYYLTQASHFLDMGSGFGLSVYHTGATVGCKSTGIEYFEDKLGLSLKLGELYKNKYGNEEFLAVTQFIQGDLATKDDFNPCTHIYSYNITWSKN
jgi:hypothetical protein